jgi:hypothetical protein
VWSDIVSPPLGNEANLEVADDAAMNGGCRQHEAWLVTHACPIFGKAREIPDRTLMGALGHQ